MCSKCHFQNHFIIPVDAFFLRVVLASCLKCIAEDCVRFV